MIKFLTGPDYGRAMAQAQLLQPARSSLTGEWMAFVREQYPEETRRMDLSAFAGQTLEGASVTTEVFANMAEARRLAHAAWSRIFTLGQAPVSLMQAVSAQIDAAQHSRA